jgi:hypothetical protein
MQDRWAVMNSEGTWWRDDLGAVRTFAAEADALAWCAHLRSADPAAGWEPECFTLDDALEEQARSPFSAEGGL